MTDKKLPRTPDTPADTPENPSRRRLLGSMAIAGAALAAGCHAPGSPDDGKGVAGAGSTAGGAGREAALDRALREHVKHVVVIYCENRSFNNLFADFPGLEQPLAKVPAERLLQRDRDGTVMKTLPPIWQGLIRHDQTLDGKSYPKLAPDAITGLANAPWELHLPDGTPLPHGLVTRDLVHRFYVNQMQINGGRNDGFAAWGDSGALLMGHYIDNASNLHLWKLARRYTLCDNFFMGAFGGSFLNHQYLVAAQPPFYPDADTSPAKLKIAVLEDGPEGHRLKLADDSPASAMDGKPTFASHASLTPDFHAINTFGPPYQPGWSTDEKNPQRTDWSSGNTLPPQEHLTIGDTLSAKGVDWAWYAGAWQMALDGKGDQGLSDAFPTSPNFQAHHQPLNYFRHFAPGSTLRKHIRDAGTGRDASGNRFLADIEAGRLPQVSFYKPQGDLNMHAGYSSVSAGDEHVNDVIEALQASPAWKDTVVIVTVDENGGWWDHVAPPKADRWGPGTRIPALVISPHAKKGHVEHAVHDTGSIQRFLNRRFGLNPLPGIVKRDEAMRKHNDFAPGDLTAALDLG